METSVSGSFAASYFCQLCGPRLQHRSASKPPPQLEDIDTAGDVLQRLILPPAQRTDAARQTSISQSCDPGAWGVTQINPPVIPAHPQQSDGELLPRHTLPNTSKQ
ncbi:hypothetical protein GN956_G26094 [Arapaima gigas]